MRNLRMREPVNTLTDFVPFLAAVFALVILIGEAKDSTSKLITMIRNLPTGAIVPMFGGISYTVGAVI